MLFISLFMKLTHSQVFKKRMHEANFFLQADTHLTLMAFKQIFI